LGLFAFGLTTALLQMKHTRLTGHQDADKSGVENLVWGFAIFYGGLLQMIAGLSEIRRNNIFGYTAFLSYGGFWMSLGTAEILINLYADEGQAINPKATQAMLILMGIFTFVLWICTFKQNKTLCALIGMLMTTFFFLAIGVDSEVCDYIAGWCGIVTAAIAYWLGGAELVNDIIGCGKEIVPLGHFSGNRFRFAGHFHVPGRSYFISFLVNFSQRLCSQHSFMYFHNRKNSWSYTYNLIAAVYVWSW
jgi:succinate-acetate transporter protein